MNSKDIAIKAENISKRYRIGLKEHLPKSISGAILDFVKSPLKNYRKYRSLYRFDDGNSNPASPTHTIPSDIVWALGGISFELKQGEALAIIGKNGAGKSTLLKILARITSPTSGCAEIFGRVSSLLEVGTGFHPELTGRENIYLNGTILGMKKKEIDRKHDEIVNFSGVEKFIDTPVKRFSSGMIVRLAFAVAAHLEPEILIVDEVLAVGDAEFQKKCLGKMSTVASEGRTVLFVSHNMVAVETLCKKAICLENGKIINEGDTADVVSAYLQRFSMNSSRFENGIVHIRNTEHSVKTIAMYCDGEPSSLVYTGCEMNIRVYFESSILMRYPVLGFLIKNSFNLPILGINNKHYADNLVNKPVDHGTISMKIPNLPLIQGEYFVDIFLGDGNEDFDIIENAFAFNVEARKFTESSLMVNPTINLFYIKDVFWSYNNSNKQP
jgi:lipopolysaccharide transport system ATP-binding protein